VPITFTVSWSASPDCSQHSRLPTWELSSCYKIVTTEVCAHFAGRISRFLYGWIWQDSAIRLSSLAF